MSDLGYAAMTRGNGLHVPVDAVPITPGPDALEPALRGIRVNTAGTVTVNTPLGDDRVLNFLEGETRFLVITHVTAATATGLEGLV